MAARQDQLSNPTFLSLVSDQALRSAVICGRIDLGHAQLRWLRRRPPAQQAEPNWLH